MSLLGKVPLGIPIVIAVWFTVSWAGAVNPLFLPDPTSVLRALRAQLASLSLWNDLFMSAYRAFSGLLISACAGIPLGLLLGRMPGVYRHLEFLVDFIRSIPSATLFPLFILAFGIGNLSKVAVVVYGCFFIILMAAIYGGKENPDRERRIATLRSLRATDAQIYRWVIFPDALSSILAGLRIATSISLVLVVITEMFLGSNNGLGKRIYDTYLAYKIPDMYATLIVLGSLGYIANMAVGKLEGNYRQRLGGQNL